MSNDDFNAYSLGKPDERFVLFEKSVYDNNFVTTPLTKLLKCQQSEIKCKLLVMRLHKFASAKTSKEHFLQICIWKARYREIMSEHIFVSAAR